jgi:hypothetical protein
MISPHFRYYSRGAAHIPMPSHAAVVKNESWYNHTSFICLLFLIVVLCFLKFTIDTKSILEPRTQTIIIRPATPKPKPEPKKESIVERLIHRVKKAREKKRPKITVKKKIEPKKITPKTITPKKVAPTKTAIRKIEPKKIKAKTIAENKIMPKKVLPKDLTPKKLAPKKIAPQKTVAKNVTPKKLMAKSTNLKKTVVNKIAPKAASQKNIAIKKTALKKAPSTDFIPQSRIQPLALGAQPKQLSQKTSPKKQRPLKSAVQLSSKQPDLNDISFERPTISGPQNRARASKRDKTATDISTPRVALDVSTPLKDLPKQGDMLEDPYFEETIEIVGQILGESDRVKNLKQAIYRKAMGLDSKGSPFCCKINNFDFKVMVDGGTHKKVTIEFTPADVPFDIISKLERQLPRGIKKCTN